MENSNKQMEFIGIVPVIPSSDISRDITWYKEKAGFETYFSDNMYAVIYRDNICIHLQWHAGTAEDPFHGGSVIRIYMKNIQPLFEELLQRGTITAGNLRTGTLWKTNEFGFFDLNSNAIFVMEDIK